MVHIAIAGGSGQVAREIIDALVAAEKHAITILTRHSPPPEEPRPGVSWVQIDYHDRDSLVAVLSGVHTVLSFIQGLGDVEKTAEKNLVDACIAAGVRRFAPSEWGSKGLEDMPWWAGKGVIREYLAEKNANKKVLEYTLFQPGLFLNYLASPYQTARHVAPLDTMVDFQHGRAIVVDGCDATITLTAVEDVARVVARAVEYEGAWPDIGGIVGNRVTVSRLLEIGERVRGQKFAVEKVKREDLERGELKASWTLGKKHTAVADEEVGRMAKMVMVGMLLSSAKGAWDGSDQFNRIFPDYGFQKVEEYLAEVWAGKP